MSHQRWLYIVLLLLTVWSVAIAPISAVYAQDDNNPGTGGSTEPEEGEEEEEDDNTQPTPPLPPSNRTRINNALGLPVCEELVTQQPLQVNFVQGQRVLYRWALAPVEAVRNELLFYNLGQNQFQLFLFQLASSTSNSFFQFGWRDRLQVLRTNASTAPRSGQVEVDPFSLNLSPDLYNWVLVFYDASGRALCRSNNNNWVRTAYDIDGDPLLCGSGNLQEILSLCTGGGTQVAQAGTGTGTGAGGAGGTGGTGGSSGGGGGPGGGAVCGNGFIEAGETCGEPGLPAPGVGFTCNASCQVVPVIPPACNNNGVVEGTEVCDDGNLSNTDACLNTCQPATCGDTFVRAGFEQCDPPNGVTCSATCQNIAPPACNNNGVVEGTEVCDDGNLSNTDACLNTCQPATCGDTFVRVGFEQCDPPNGVTCNATCQNIPPPACNNNGIVEGSEVCDDGNGSNADDCRTTCVPNVCGDGILRTGGTAPFEECDGGPGCTSCQIVLPSCATTFAGFRHVYIGGALPVAPNLAPLASRDTEAGPDYLQAQHECTNVPLFIFSDNVGNILEGRDFGDQIFGNGGDDFLYGFGGNDSLDGGAGSDFIDGGAGTDLARGFTGNNTVNLDAAGNGNVTDGVDNDSLVSIENIQTGTGNDSFFITGSGNNSFDAGTGQNTYDVSSVTSGVNVNQTGLDALTSGGAGNDTLRGFQNYITGSGNDTFIMDTIFGGNTIDGNGGVDSFQFSGSGDTTVIHTSTGNTSSTGSIDDGANVTDFLDLENITTSDGNDLFIVNRTAGTQNNIFNAGTGVDTFEGLLNQKLTFLLTDGNGTVGGINNGNDTLLGFEALDRSGTNTGDTITMNATGAFSYESADLGNGNDSIFGNNFVGNVDLGDGNNTFTLSNVGGNVFGGTGNDRGNVSTVGGDVDLGDGNNSLGANTVTGSIFAGTGNDTVNANVVGGNVELGNGNNSLTASNVTGNVSTGTGNDTLNLSNITGITVTGTGADSVTAGPGITGNVSLQAGNDTLTITDAGDNSMDGGADTDRLNIIIAGAFGSNTINLDVGTGNISGSGIGNDSFANFENLSIQGTTGDDELIITGINAALNVIFNGLGGNDEYDNQSGLDLEVNMASTGNATIESGANTIGTLSSVERITTGAGDDTFQGIDSANNTLEAGAGTDAYDMGNATTAITLNISGDNVGGTTATATGTQIGNDSLTNFESFTTGSSSDSFNIDAVLGGNGAPLNVPITFDGRAGIDSLTYTGSANLTIDHNTTGNATLVNSGTGIIGDFDLGTSDVFQSIERFYTGDGNDTFSITGAGAAQTNVYSAGLGTDRYNNLIDESRELTLNNGDGTIRGAITAPNVGRDSLFGFEEVFLNGAAGNDTVVLTATGAFGYGSINLGGGNDTLTINDDSDNTLDGAAGTDTLLVQVTTGAGSGTILLDMAGGNGTISGAGVSSTGGDTLSNWERVDILGTGSADYFVIRDGQNNQVDGAAGTDTLVTEMTASGNVTVDRLGATGSDTGGNLTVTGAGIGTDTYLNIERFDLTGFSGNDSITLLDNLANIIDGALGTDTLNVGHVTTAVGATLNGNGSTGSMTGAQVGNDTLFNIEGIITGSGNDNILVVDIDTGSSTTGGGADIFTLDNSALTILGAYNVDLGSGNDTINVTDAGNNSIQAGIGTDRGNMTIVDSNTGTDTYIVDITRTGNDVAVDDLSSTVLGVGDDTFFGLERFDITGTSQDDFFNVNDARSNQISGGTGGNDAYIVVDTALNPNLLVELNAANNGFVTGSNTATFGTDTLVSIENVFTEDGDDTFEVASVGDRTLDAGNGTDNYVYEGAGNTSLQQTGANTFQATNSSFAGGVDTLQDFENLSTGTGNDTFNLTDTNNRTLNAGNNGVPGDTYIYSGAGAVTVEVDGVDTAGVEQATITDGAGPDTLLDFEAYTFNTVTATFNIYLDRLSDLTRIDASGVTGTATFNFLNSALNADYDTVNSGALPANRLIELVFNSALTSVKNMDFSAVNTTNTTGLNVDLSNPSISSGSGQTIFGALSNVALKITNASTGPVNITGTQNNDSITGNTGANSLVGGLGNDTLSGGDGADTLSGGDGDDNLNGGNGADTILGGIGNDTVTLGSDTANDSIDAGADVDTVDASAATSGVNINLNTGLATSGGVGTDTINNFENIVGSSFNDNLTGNANENSIFGGNGNDTIDGQGGNDVLLGQIGNDSIQGGTGEDLIEGGDGADTLSGGGDNDLIKGDAGTDNITGGSGDDTLEGGSENDQIRGNDGDDLIKGGTGNDSLWGGIGADLVEGEAGNDNIWGGRASSGDVAGTDGEDTIYATAGDNIFGGNQGAGDDVGDQIFVTDAPGATVYGGNQNTTGAGNDGNDTINVVNSAGSTIYGGNFNSGGGNGTDGGDILNLFNSDNSTVYGGNNNQSGLGGSDGNDNLTIVSDNVTAYGGNNNVGAGGDDGSDTFVDFSGSSTSIGNNTYFGGNNNVGADGDDLGDRMTVGSDGNLLFGGNNNAGGNGDNTGADTLTLLGSGSTPNTVFGGNLNSGGTGSDANGDSISDINGISDVIFGGNQNTNSTCTALICGDGSDTINSSSSGNDEIYAGNENSAGEGEDLGGNSINASGGSDTIYLGNDNSAGGTGSTAGNNTVRTNDGVGNDTICVGNRGNSTLGLPNTIVRDTGDSTLPNAGGFCP
jgi:Ca2+-binding RTX toxin-like protein